MTTPTNTLDKGKVQLGFIGLGLMGSRLTHRLHSAGWNVQAWNRSPRPADVVRPAATAPQSVLASSVSANGDLDLAAIPPFVIAQRTNG
jgi:3-hydroxyisobutyrate dehydrogenase-like beta-hydroxyacid dehydrogenase